MSKWWWLLLIWAALAALDRLECQGQATPPPSPAWTDPRQPPPVPEPFVQCVAVPTAPDVTCCYTVRYQTRWQPNPGFWLDPFPMVTGERAESCFLRPAP